MPVSYQKEHLLEKDSSRGITRGLDGRYERRSIGTDFLDFLGSLLRLALAPVVYPVRMVYQAITAPLTMSLILKLALLLFLLVASSIITILAVGTFYWSSSVGGPVDVEGWMVYGSTKQRLPHASVSLPQDKILEDMHYDVQVEMELVRPNKMNVDTDNFMLSLELRSLKDPGVVVISAAQPSLVPSPLPLSFLSIPSLLAQFLPPCVIPWPFRSLCPSRLLGSGRKQYQKVQQRRAKAGFMNSPLIRNIVPIKKDLMEGVILKPSQSSGSVVGSAFLSVGREDAFENSYTLDGRIMEIRTTGWVVVRFIPRPGGIRWLVSSHPLPPLLLLPPLSLSLSLSSSLFACIIMTLLQRSRRRTKATSKLDRKSLESTRRNDPFTDDNKLAKKDKSRLEEAWKQTNYEVPNKIVSEIKGLVSGDEASETGVASAEETIDSNHFFDEDSSKVTTDSEGE
ncbi:uncharacterized protein L203_103473 [Cryptococcus depauperatus CBS 7841]|uniref:Endoplasmic reticulum protein n=1 Tax=Cryptococcus depauperatus CBS 7841 TaxID=1295531 RepID=A0AAJ8JTT7_9TREE